MNIDAIRKWILSGLIIVAILFLCGVCIRADSSKNILVKENIHRNTVTTDEIINDKSLYYNNYYNRMKINNEWIYYCDGQILRKHSVESGKDIKIVEGNFWLGEITNKKLYMLSMPSSAEEKEMAEIMCLELESNQIEKLYTIEENIWGYRPPFLYDQKLMFCEEFMGKKATCHFYKEVEENEIQEVNGDTSFYSNNVTDVSEGTLNSILKYNAYSCLNRSNHKLEIFNSEGILLAQIDSDYIDCMFTQSGFVYTDKNMNIHLVTIYDKDNIQDSIIYLYDGTFVNYATSDENGIYGYITRNRDVQIIQLDWNGKLSILSRETGDKNDIAEANLSAFGEMVAYCWKNEIKVIIK